MMTFQLPAIPPTGSMPLFSANFAPTSSGGGGTPPQRYYIYIRAMPASTLFMPGITTGGSSLGGYVYAYIYSSYTDSSSGTSTMVNLDMPMMGPPPFMFVPRLFGGSWVTVAVSVSSTSNVTVYSRDSVLSSSLSFGASDGLSGPKLYRC